MYIHQISLLNAHLCVWFFILNVWNFRIQINYCRVDNYFPIFSPEVISQRENTNALQKVVKLLPITCFIFSSELLFVVGIFWSIKWNFSWKITLSILSRPLTTERNGFKKCCASKILRILSLFFMKRYIIRMVIHRNVAFSGYFSVFWMRYSRTRKRDFQKIAKVFEPLAQYLKSLVSFLKSMFLRLAFTLMG